MGCGRIADNIEFLQLRPLRRFKAHSNTSHNFIRATFAHSSLLVSGSEDGVLYMWDREDSEVLQTLEGHEGIVSTFHDET
jgi:WD40 repeat protein